MSSRTFAALAAFVLGCGGEEPPAEGQVAGIALSPTQENGYGVPDGVLPVPLGAHIRVRVESAECESNPWGWRGCTGLPVEVAAVEVEPESAFTVVTQSNEELVLRAAAAGPAKLTVRGTIEGVPALGEYGFDARAIDEVRAWLQVRESEEPLPLADGVRLLAGERYAIAVQLMGRGSELYGSVSPMTIDGGRLVQDEDDVQRYLALDRTGAVELRLASGQTLSLRAVDAPSFRYEWQRRDGELFGDLQAEDEGEVVHLPTLGLSGTVTLLSTDRCRLGRSDEPRTELPLRQRVFLEAVGEPGSCELEVRRGEQRQQITVDLATAAAD